jgi:hypothetical protein
VSEALQRKVRLLDNALQFIARRGDCEYLDERDRPVPCECPVCVAKSTLEEARGWRYIGAKYERVTNGFNARETKIHAAWAKLADDHLLSQILCEERGGTPTPTARDWYVATSVVQWLATNVGMSVLEAAGFKYSQFEQDRANYDRQRQEREKTP